MPLESNPKPVHSEFCYGLLEAYFQEGDLRVELLVFETEGSLNSVKAHLSTQEKIKLILINAVTI